MTNAWVFVFLRLLFYILAFLGGFFFEWGGWVLWLVAIALLLLTRHMEEEEGR